MPSDRPMVGGVRVPHEWVPVLRELRRRLQQEEPWAKVSYPRLYYAGLTELASARGVPIPTRGERERRINLRLPPGWGGLVDRLQGILTRAERREVTATEVLLRGVEHLAVRRGIDVPSLDPQPPEPKPEPPPKRPRGRPKGPPKPEQPKRRPGRPRKYEE